MNYKKNENYSINELKYFLSNERINDIFIVTGEKSFFRSGASKLFKEILKNKKVKFFFKKSAYPEIGELRILYKKLREFSPELILAIGGGSVIDYAKMANLNGIDYKLEKIIKDNSYKISGNFRKLIAVPTTAGSGAEVTSNAVIYINKIKYSVEGDKLKPFTYFLLPEIIIKNKKTLKASAGFDAISQAVESIISVKSTKQSLIYATKSLDFSLKSYLEFIKKPTLTNTTNMSLAALYSGKAISISKTTAPHAVSYPFTSLYNISHGHAVSLTLEKFLKFNFVNSEKRIAKFDIKKRYFKLFSIFKVKTIYELEKKIILLKKNANLTDDFRKLNINIDSNIEKILKGVNLMRLGNNPVKLEKNDIKNIIKNNF